MNKNLCRSTLPGQTKKWKLSIVSLSTTHPTLSSHFLPASIQPTTDPKSEETSSPQEPSTQISARDVYTAEAKKQGIIDEHGGILFPHQDRLTLEPDDQDEIRNFWNAQRRFKGEGLDFTWNFHTFLNYLVPYFSKNPCNGTVELTQGTFHTVGKGFWEKSMRRKIAPEVVTKHFAPEMWNFCTNPPRCYEFWFRLPASVAEGWQLGDYQRFQGLVIYSIAVQALPNPPKYFFEALREFGALLSPTPPTDEKQIERLAALNPLIELIRKHSLATYTESDHSKIQAVTLEIPFAPNASLKITLTSLLAAPGYLLDDFRLDISSDNTTLSSRLICPRSAWEALHDQFIHRLTLSTSLKDLALAPLALGRYWAHLTCGGRVFHGEELERNLIENLVRGHKDIPAALATALAVGRYYLPQGKDAILAYYCNVLHFLQEHRVAPQDFPMLKLRNGEHETAPESSFGNFLQVHDSRAMLTSPLDAALRLVGMLQASLPALSSDTIQCRKTEGRMQLEMSWKAHASGIYLVLPWDFEQALEQLKHNKEACLAYISQALALLSPSYHDASTQGSPVPRGLPMHLNAIYQDLCNDERYIESALRLFFLLHGGGWKTLDESDVLDLPRWISWAADDKKVHLVLEKLTAAYNRSRFSSLFNSIKEKILVLGNHSAAGCRATTLEVLVQSEEMKILAPAWTLYAQVISPTEGLPFLLEIATGIREAALPFALNRACEFCHPQKSILTSEERMSLLVKYLDRIIQLNDQGQLLSSSYGPKLIELLDALVSADSSLRRCLLPYPEVLKRIPSAQLLDEKHLLENMRETLPQLKTDPGAWWAKFLELQNTLREQGTFDSYSEEFDAIFAKALLIPKAGLFHRTGFVNIWNRVAPKLYEKGELISILRHIPVAKTDKIFYPWFQKCLLKWMESGDPIENGVAILSAYREAGVYQHANMTRTDAVRILKHLTDGIVEERKTPDLTTQREIKFLIFHVKPNPAEIPHLLDCLLAYYSTPLELGNVAVLIDDIMKTLSFFIAHKDLRIIEKIESLSAFLRKVPKEAVLWSRFTELVECLKNEDLFLDASIGLLESFATDPFLAPLSIKAPPFQCFKKPILNIERRLSETQRSRLAAAYGALTVKDDHENTTIAALPPINWVMELLMSGGQWEGGALLLLHLPTRRRDNAQTVLREALQIAPHLLTQTDSPLCADFAKFLAGVPTSQLNSSWKPHLAGLIAHLPATPVVDKLFSHLHKLAEKNEKQFFEHCQTLYRRGSTSELEPLLSSYQKTQIVPEFKPNAPAPSPTQALAQAPQQKKEPETPQSILQRLKTCPPGETVLWEKFFHSLPPYPSKNLLVEAWKVWLEKHPLETLQPGDGKHWHLAINKCLSPLDMLPLFTTFLQQTTSTLLKKLEKEGCRNVATLCLKLGIHTAWREPSGRPATMINLMQSVLLGDEKLDEIGNLWSLIDRTSTIRLALLLAHQQNPLFHLIGHKEFLSLLSEIERKNEYSSIQNLNLFRSYCERPYIPQDLTQQWILRTWIEKSWPLHKPILDANQVCLLIKTLCMFSYTREGQEEVSCDPENILPKWDELVIGTWKLNDALTNRGGASIPMIVMTPPTHHSLVAFFDTTITLMDNVMSHTPYPEKLHRLLAIHQGVNVFSAGIVEPNAPYLVFFRLRWCSNILSCVQDNTPESRHAVMLALKDLLAQMPLLQGKGPITSKALKTFIFSLSGIFNLGKAEIDLTPLVLSIIDAMMHSSWIVQAEQTEEVSWYILLFSLCKCVKQAHPDVRRAVSQVVLKVFMNSTHPSLIQKTAIQDPADFTSRCIPLLAMHFLTLPELECLTSGDWSALFEGISEGDSDKMVETLSAEIHGEGHSILLGHSLALARLFSHAKNRSEFLITMIQSSVETIDNFIPLFHAESDVHPQLQLRAQWILANSRLNSQNVRAQKIHLTTELTQLVISCIEDEASYKAYSTYLFEVLSDDVEVALAMSAALQNLTPALDKLLGNFKTFLKWKIEKLQS